MDSTYTSLSVGSPSQVVPAWGDPDAIRRRTAEAGHRLRQAHNGTRLRMAGAFPIVSPALAGCNLSGTVRSRLKHVVRRAEVFTDRAGVQVFLRLLLTAG